MKVINGHKTFKYNKDFMKINIDSDDNLPLNKQLKLLTVKLVVRSVFEEDGKYYPQTFLEKSLYEL